MYIVLVLGFKMFSTSFCWIFSHLGNHDHTRLPGSLSFPGGFGTWLGFYQMKTLQHEAHLRPVVLERRELRVAMKGGLRKYWQDLSD